MIKIEWVDLFNYQVVPKLVDIFLKNTTEKYITHIEIEEGRAIDKHTWSPNLKEILTKELEHILQFRNRLAVLYTDDIPTAYALVKRSGRTATVEDIVVTNKGEGSQLLEWLETRFKHDGIEEVIGDLGTDNLQAQRFMQKRGYEAITVVYRKQI
jgi:GNAT superfamily N-acetyltransferase